MQAFYDLLFRPGEKTCFSSDPYGTAILGVEHWEYVSCEYFVLNPLKDRRADRNVTAYRNILVEFDTIPISDQLAHVEKIGMPYSTCVFSGGKSYHFILSFAQDLSLDDYRAAKDRLYRAVGIAIDKACGNPSRFTRCPDRWRKDKGQLQALVAVKSAIQFPDFEKWLDGRGCLKVITPTKRPKVEALESNEEWFTDLFLSVRTKVFLKNGADEGERHRNLVLAAYDFRRVGKPMAEAKRRLFTATDKPQREVEAVVEYCYGTSDDD